MHLYIKGCNHSRGAVMESCSRSRSGACLAGGGTSSMSASFQPPGPAKRARPLVPSRLFMTLSHVALMARLMSCVVRHVLPTCRAHACHVSAPRQRATSAHKTPRKGVV